MSVTSALEVTTPISATTRYILVDRSDIANFPHDTDAALRIETLILHLKKLAAAGVWVVRIGVVEEVDATNGSVKFFHSVVLGDQPSIDLVIPFSNSKRLGMSLDPANTQFVSTADVSGSTNWQTDVNLVNPAGTTVGPGAGDIVIEIEEVAGTTTLTFSITAIYDMATAH